MVNGGHIYVFYLHYVFITLFKYAQPAPIQTPNLLLTPATPFHSQITFLGDIQYQPFLPVPRFLLSYSNFKCLLVKQKHRSTRNQH
jgi:hypothetical protein